MLSYNRLLTNKDRFDYDGTIKLLWELCPQTMLRKIERANVQQAFVLDTVRGFADKNQRILSAGCYEDTAYETLKKLGYKIIGIDPMENGIDLHLYTYIQYPDLFDVVFATSVIEHIPEDEIFLNDICKLIKPNGYGILTMDYLDSWKPGDRLPATDVRFYTMVDLKHRLQQVLIKNHCQVIDEGQWEGEPDFRYDGCLYSFATFVFRKS